MDSEVASPIERDDESISELNITQLSLPDSFDESLCLDLYKEFKGQSCGSKSETEIEKAWMIGSCVGQTDGQQENIPHHNDLELKVRELLSTNLELKEKGGLYDSMKKCSKENEAQLEELRSQMQHQISLRESSNVREKELQHQILEFKRKVHLISIDLEHSRKESKVNLNVAANAEKYQEASASALKSTQQKNETALSRLHTEREAIKSCCDREIARIREESNNEIISSRAHQSEAFARESKLLCDARDQAIEQSKLLQQELSELRTDRENKEAENSDIIKELERQLADVRSDLKVKSCELNTLQACQGRTTAEANEYKTENDKNKKALAQLHQHNTKVERQSAKLEEAIRQKDEALEIYHHHDLLVDCDAENVEPNSTGYFSGRRSLVKNSVALARKCRELQSLLKRQSSELSIERENNEVLSRKEESNQMLFKELTIQSNKDASAYIISAVNARDNEILKLSSKINSLQMDLNKTAQERDDFSSKQDSCHATTC